MHVADMTCSSCELLLERKLRALPGITHVHADHRTGVVRLTGSKKGISNNEAISEVITKAGYRLVQKGEIAPKTQIWIDIAASLLIIVAGWLILRTFDLSSFAPSTSGALSLGGTFLIGLVAGMSSCLAVTGGLLLALAARHNELHRAETTWQKLAPLLSFNMGRLAGYFTFGGIVGLLGQSISLSARTTGYANIIIALVMIYLALTILGFIPKGSFPIRPPKKLSHWIAGLSDSDHPAAPLTLGALTFFLPCGFTQSLQLAALGSGSFLTGALLMFTFALGTLPSLLGISAVSATTKGAASRMFLRFSGTLVLFLALFNLQNGFALTGLGDALPSNRQEPLMSTEQVLSDVQEVSMKVTSHGSYEPNLITIKAGVPVRWIVDGTDAFGCTSVLTIPSMNISRALQQGQNVIEFTPQQKGHLGFMCSMGMVRGSFNVI